MRFTIVKVVDVEPLGGHRLRVSFSDNSFGEHDFADLFRDPGPMVEMGVLSWPNGFDMDAIKLHMDMAAAGELKRDAAE